MRRCHRVPEPLGNLYADPLDAVLRRRTCPNARCDCWVGYSQMLADGAPGPLFR